MGGKQKRTTTNDKGVNFRLQYFISVARIFSTKNFETFLLNEVSTDFYFRFSQ